LRFFLGGRGLGGLALSFLCYTADESGTVGLRPTRTLAISESGRISLDLSRWGERIGKSKSQPKLPGKHQGGAQNFTSTLKRKEKSQTMKLQINVPISGLDLAGLLHGEEGLFLCQNRGQDYIAVAKAGHSIAYGPTPIGRVIIEQPSANVGPEPWFVTKISNSTEFAEFTGNRPR
jgi:hypothetical protein